MKSQLKALLIAAVFIDICLSSLVLPIVPILGTKLQMSAYQWGGALALVPLSQLVTQPLWGIGVSRFGAGVIVSSALLLKVAATVFFLETDSSLSLFLSLATMGMVGGVWVGCQSIVVTSLEEKDRARAHSHLAAGSATGLLTGPASVAAYSTYFGDSWAGLSLPYAVPGALMAIGVIVATKRGLISRPVASSKVNREGSFRTGLRALAEIRHQRAILIALGASVALGMLMQMYMVALPAWALSNFGWGAADLSLAYMSGSFVMILMQVFVVGRLIERLNVARALVAASLVGIIGYAVAPAVPYVWAVYASIVLYAAFSAISNPSLAHLLGSNMTAEQAGPIYGVNASFFATGRVLGPALAGIAVSFAGPSAAFILGALIAGILAVALIISFNTLLPSSAPDGAAPDGVAPPAKR